MTFIVDDSDPHLIQIDFETETSFLLHFLPACLLSLLLTWRHRRGITTSHSVSVAQHWTAPHHTPSTLTPCSIFVDEWHLHTHLPVEQSKMRGEYLVWGLETRCTIPYYISYSYHNHLGETVGGEKNNYKKGTSVMKLLVFTESNLYLLWIYGTSMFGALLTNSCEIHKRREWSKISLSQT